MDKDNANWQHRILRIDETIMLHAINTIDMIELQTSYMIGSAYII